MPRDPLARVRWPHRVPEGRRHDARPGAAGARLRRLRRRDTATAVATLGLLAGLDLAAAGTLANVAASVVVQKPGTATLDTAELIAAAADDRYTHSVPHVPKVWGSEQWIENNDRYCCKLLNLKKGFQCSLHYHKVKDEMFLVRSGRVRLELGGETLELREGNFVRVPPETKHRFTGLEDSVIIEISTHHDEADSYRIEPSRQVSEA